MNFKRCGTNLAKTQNFQKETFMVLDKYISSQTGEKKYKLHRLK